jgi:hypothetical protein
MADLNLCSITAANTGGIGCDRKKGVPAKFLAGNTSFDTTDTADAASMYDALQALINQASGAVDKLFPFPSIQGNTKNSEGNQTGALGYGLTITLREGLPSYTFQVLCGQSQYARLRVFNNLILPILFIDKDNVLWGWRDAAGIFQGYSASIFVSGNEFESGTAVEDKTATIEIRIQSANEFHDKAAYIEGIEEADYKGLNNGQLAKVGTVSATTKFEIKVPDMAGVNAVLNFADFYSTELAAAGLWTAKTGATFGTPLTITGVTYNASDKTWSVAFDNTAYTALASAAEIKVNLADPAILFAAGVTGVEGLSTTITKP